MKLWIILLACAMMVYFAFFAGPNSADIIANTTIDVTSGQIEHDGIQYHVKWSEEQRFAGFARYSKATYFEFSPFITNDIIVTTGEFADPKIVSISPVRNHSTFVSARQKPSGTLFFIHCMPLDLVVLKQLNRVDTGDWVELTGKLADANTIYGPRNNIRLQTKKGSHPIMLVTDVRKLTGPIP